MEANDEAVLEVIQTLLGVSACVPPPDPVPAPRPLTSSTVGGVEVGGSGDWINRAPAPLLQQQTILVAGPNISQPARLSNEVGPHSQGQFNYVPATNLPSNMVSTIQPAEIFNKQPMYVLAPETARVRAVPKSRRKRKCQQQQEDNQPCTKKPLNAFMLYLKDQRKNFQGTNSAMLNKFLGNRWNELSDKQQAIYFDLARQEERLKDHKKPAKSASVTYACTLGQNSTHDVNEARERKTLSGLPKSAEAIPCLPHTSLKTPSPQASLFNVPTFLHSLVEGSSIPESSSKAPRLSESSLEPPSIPECSAPRLPELLVSSIPELSHEAPSLSESSFESPSIPECSALRLPELLSSSISECSAPRLPEFLAPGIPEFSFEVPGNPDFCVKATNSSASLSNVPTLPESFTEAPTLPDTLAEAPSPQVSFVEDSSLQDSSVNPQSLSFKELALQNSLFNTINGLDFSSTEPTFTESKFETPYEPDSSFEASNLLEFIVDFFDCPDSVNQATHFLDSSVVEPRHLDSTHEDTNLPI